MTPTADAAARFGAFVEGIKRWQRNPENKQRCPYHGQICKAPATVLRTALVLHVMRVCCGEAVEPGSLERATLERALRIYDEFAVPHYARLLGSMLTPRELTSADIVDGWLRRGPRRTRLQLSEVQRARLSKKLQKRADVADALNILVERGALRPDLIAATAASPRTTGPTRRCGRAGISERPPFVRRSVNDL